jgi:hypothetical protein
MMDPIVVDHVLTVTVFAGETVTAMEFVPRAGTRTAAIMVAIVVMRFWRRAVTIVTVTMAATVIMIIRERGASLCGQHHGDQCGNCELVLHMAPFILMMTCCLAARIWIGSTGSNYHFIESAFLVMRQRDPVSGVTGCIRMNQVCGSIAASFACFVTGTELVPLLTLSPSCARSAQNDSEEITVVAPSVRNAWCKAFITAG